VEKSVVFKVEDQKEEIKDL